MSMEVGANVAESSKREVIPAPVDHCAAKVLILKIDIMTIVH
jgi:hypothetical protein